jgi:hypothetical protein
MTKVLKITMQSRLDSPTIDNAILNIEPLEIEFINEYSGNLDATSIVSINDLVSGDLTNLKGFLDFLTIAIEPSAFIFTILLSAKTFNLQDSYVRDVKNTSGVLTVIPNGTPILVRFEIPGFNGNQIFDVTLWYNQAFSPTELTSLRDALGIIVSGNGLEFTISNTNVCKVSFIKPATATESYVVTSEADNIIFTENGTR